MAKHTRDDVIKWWDNHPQLTAREVRAHFIREGSDFQEPTIRQWRRKAAERAQRDAVTGRDRDSVGLNGGRGETERVHQPSRARVPPEKLERLADSTKRKLRRACEGATDFLASASEWRDRIEKGETDEDAAPFDWRQWEACARGLKTLIDFAPGVDSFDEQTAGASAARGATTEDRKRLDEAMFGPPGEGAAPALRLVDAATK